MYKHYNPNPAGARVGDCAVRALSCATGQSWERVYAGLCAMGYDICDLPSADRVWGAYLADRGFRRHALPDECPLCYTVSDFSRDHPQGVYVLALGGHVVCVTDGDWYDTWDSGAESPLCYWAKEG